MIFELSEKGDLEQLIESRKKQNLPFTEQEVLRILINIIMALDEIHELKIQHRDLKASNILIFTEENGHDYLKLADFGIAKLQSQTDFNVMTSIIIGTLPICSPERFRGITNSDKEDVWALGILGFYLCTFQYPFFGPNLQIDVLNE